MHDSFAFRAIVVFVQLVGLYGCTKQGSKTPMAGQSAKVGAGFREAFPDSELAMVDAVEAHTSSFRGSIQLTPKMIQINDQQHVLVDDQPIESSWLSPLTSVASGEHISLRIHSLVRFNQWLQLMGALKKLSGQSLYVAARPSGAPTSVGFWKLNALSQTPADGGMAEDGIVVSGAWDEFTKNWNNITLICIAGGQDCAPQPAKPNVGGILQITLQYHDEGGMTFYFTQYDKPQYKVQRVQELDLNDDNEGVRMTNQKIPLSRKKGTHEKGDEASFTFRATDLKQGAPAFQTLAPFCQERPCPIRIVSSPKTPVGRFLRLVDALQKVGHVVPIFENDSKG